MKKLFLLLILLPGLAWADLGTSTDGKEASVTCTHSLACDSGWVVFGYDGDAGEVDTANMYDSLKVLPCFSGNGKTLCGDGLDLDSIGTHVVKIYYFFGDAIIDIQVGIWEHKDGAAGGSDTTSIKAMMQKNWDPDTDGELSVETSTGADSSVMKKMMQNNWDTDTDGLLSVEADACAGSGARTVIIWVKDITDSTGIPGFEIDIEDSIGGGGVYGNTTNPSGCCTLSLDDATWTIHLQKVPYSITSPVYETISGNTTLTYYATPFTPGSPPADSLCVVYGYVKKSNGTPYVGAKVEMWMDVYPVTFGGILIDVVTKQVVYTNTAGRFEFSNGIYYSSSLNPSNLKWKVRIKTTNWLWEGRVIVPSQASWEIEIPDL